MSRLPEAPLRSLQTIGLQIALPLGSLPEQRATLEDLAPWARGGLLLLSGGPAFFEAFQKDRHLYEDRSDPLDDWTRDNIEAFVTTLNASGIRAEARYPFWNEANPLPFQKLGQLAGLRATALFGLSLHPTYGSFVAHRALILLDREPPQDLTTPPLPSGWDPCPACSAPCVETCPPGAVSWDGWALSTCVDHRATSESCEEGCLSRLACPIGGDKRPSDEGLRFHQAASRKWITANKDGR